MFSAAHKLPVDESFTVKWSESFRKLTAPDADLPYFPVMPYELSRLRGGRLRVFVDQQLRRG